MKFHRLISLFTFTLGLWALSLTAFGSQRAVVKSEHAIIYAEIQRVTEVGYVSKGKTIKVGEVARGPYRMFPILVSGKICYIQESDLYVNEYEITGKQKAAPRPEKAEVKSESEPVEPQINFNRNRSVEVAYNSFSAGNDWNEFSKRVNGRESTSRVTNLSARYFFKRRWDFHFGGGLENYSISDGAITVSAWALAAEAKRTIWEYKDFSLQPSLTLFMSPILSASGFKLNLPLVYHLTNNSYLKAGLGYQRASITGVNISGAKNDVVLAGPNIFLGFEYFF
ncbi:MAG: hypothetical protein ACOYL6_07820 [Bacteriovoracaceae bacterium]